MSTNDADLVHLTELLSLARVLPVLRLPTAGEALAAVDACASAGAVVVELTTTTPGWTDTVSVARRRWPGLAIGVGTVTTTAHARVALERGVDFLVSPYPVPHVRESLPAGAVLVEGGMTVAEVVAAGAHGLAKLFPAHVGGPAFLRSVLAVAPGVRIIPTGGIQLASVDEWLAAGAYAVGVGTDLLAQPDLGAALARFARS